MTPPDYFNILDTGALPDLAGAGHLVTQTPATALSVSNLSFTGGTWTATFGGNTTTALAWNADAAAITAALEALASIGAGDVDVDGPLSSDPMTVTFQGALSDTPLGLTANGSGLTGPNSPYTITADPPLRGWVQGSYFVPLHLVGLPEEAA